MKMYTGIDIGSSGIKIVVLSKNSGKFHLVLKEVVTTTGVQKGKIINTKMVANDLKNAISKIEEKYDIKIKKAISCIPSYDILFDIVSSNIKCSHEIVTGDDVTESIKEAVMTKLSDDYELISSNPISFTLSNGDIVKNPIGEKSDSLELKMVITSIPRKNLYPLIDIFELCGIELIDITFKPIGDYYEVRSTMTESSVGAIINIGEDTTNISIYNKGIMIKSSIINVGSYHIDHDISYIYKTNLDDSRKLKEEYGMASVRYADKYDDMELVNEAGEKVIISQHELTEIIEARLTEILKLSKKEIKNLTNRKISYIIVLGGLSEMMGFSHLATSTLGNIAEVWNSTTLGLRHNKYSSVVGTIKYFDDKLLLRDREVAMFSTEDIEKLTTKDIDDIRETFGQFQN